jgi:hypothetical protein
MLDDYPMICHYYQTLTETDFANSSDNFYHFKNLFLLQINRLPKEMQSLYLFSINYCIRRYNTGAMEFAQDVFDFYKIGLEQELFVDGGIMSHMTFKNIARTANMNGPTIL